MVFCFYVVSQQSSMLGQRRRRWANINLPLDQCIFFVWLPAVYDVVL